ncbi:MAG: zinc-dependent alcohol dehydrogenase [Planctomycetota bacterium]
MKAVFLTDIRQVELRDEPEPPAPAAGEVLLEVESVGVCGSDMHYYRSGRIGSQIVEYPWRVGHEFSGRVLSVGEGVEHLREGVRVAVDPLIVCGKCDQCLAGREHTCRNQRFLGCPGQAPGCLAERVVMPAKCCFPVPETMTPDQAALVEPMSIGLYAQRLSGVSKGARVGVLGTGPIGLCVLAALKAAGEHTVYAADLLDNRLALAGQYDVDWTANAGDANVVEDILQREPNGLDVVFECAGEQETLDEAVELLAPGGKLMIVGIPPADRVGFDMNQMRRKELTLQNVRRQNECMEPTIELMSDGTINIDSLVTHRFGIDQTAEAFDIVADYRDGVIKAMIHVSAQR